MVIIKRNFCFKVIVIVEDIILGDRYRMVVDVVFIVVTITSSFYLLSN